MPQPRVVRRLLTASIATSVGASLTLAAGVGAASSRPDPVRDGRLDLDSFLTPGSGCGSPQAEEVARHARVAGHGKPVLRSLGRTSVVTNQADPTDVLRARSAVQERVTLTQADGLPRSGHVAIRTTASVDADLGLLTQCATTSAADASLSVDLTLAKPRRLRLDITDRGAIYQVTLQRGQQHQVLLADTAFDGSEHHDVVLAAGTWSLHALAGVVAHAPSPSDPHHTTAAGVVTIDFTLGAP